MLSLQQYNSSDDSEDSETEVLHLKPSPPENNQLAILKTNICAAPDVVPLVS